ncbi:MAG: YdeI/OmpD-associated family protein [Bacilli bacterium]|nr:YdeI/OmpD-associated family protein [Bacilli bacterium]
MSPKTEDKLLFQTADRAQWRAFLEARFQNTEEIWFVFPTLSSGEPSISYNDAVEEALCFGWIDGQAGTLDENHHIRRFTPRRKGSPYSRPNIERLLWLEEQGLIHPSVLKSVRKLIHAPFRFPKDIISAIKKDKQAWEHYQTLAEPYKRIRIAYIDAARDRPEEFKKRLDSFIKKTREGKIIAGYGGIEKYYR